MPEYYYASPNDSERRSHRRSLAGRLFDFVIVIISIVVMVVVLLSYLATIVSPHRMWILSLLGLGAPFSYAVLVLLILYWVIRWRWKYAVPMILVALLGVGKVSRYYRITPMRDYSAQHTPERGSFTVMTYNIGNFKPYYGIDQDPQHAVATGAAVIDSLSPDIVCLQEYYPDLAARSERMMRLMEEYHTVQIAPETGQWYRQAILSRFKILRSGYIMRPKTAVWADLLIREDTVRVVNNHLQSTGITAFDSEYLTGHAYLLDTAREEKLRSIVSRFHDNCVVRADEADTIRGHLDSLAPALQILCGDFNDTPLSYTYRTLARGLNDAFSEAGEGFSHTFRGFFDALRIDYIFSSDGFETLSYEVPEVPHSDHLPVLVRLKRTE